MKFENRKKTEKRKKRRKGKMKKKLPVKSRANRGQLIHVEAILILMRTHTWEGVRSRGTTTDVITSRTNRKWKRPARFLPVKWLLYTLDYFKESTEQNGDLLIAYYSISIWTGQFLPNSLHSMLSVRIAYRSNDVKWLLNGVRDKSLELIMSRTDSQWNFFWKFHFNFDRSCFCFINIGQWFVTKKGQLFSSIVRTIRLK